MMHTVATRRRGRPRKPAAAVAVFCIRLTDAERRDLEDVARDNHATLSDVLREAVNEYVMDYRERRVFSVKRKIGPS